jgi:tetratricopeptide (TPR) repeat protein
MPPPAQGKQKPNDACGCGSGAKFKKCCGGSSSAAAAAGRGGGHGGGGGFFGSPAASPLPPPPPAAARAALTADIARAFAESKAADAAGDLGRATRRCVTALSLAGDAWASGARAWSLVKDMVLYLTHLVDLQSRQGRLDAAADCHARALALLLPPHAPFWAHALTTISHAAWRDTPLHAADVRAAVAPGVARYVCARLLRRVYTDMGLAFSRAGGHAREAMGAYERALEALLAFEPAGAERDVSAAGLQENIGNQLLQRGELVACGVRYAAAAELLDGAHGGDAARLAGVRAHLESNRAMIRSALRAPGQRGGAAEDVLAEFESAWQVCEQHRQGGLSNQWHDTEGTPAGVCRTALARASTRAQRRTWLLRGFEVEGTRVAARSAAARACRACSAPPAAGSKLRRCAACGRVAYCGGACQKGDWARHKRVCADAAGAAAALDDATCVGCRQPLLDDAATPACDEHAPLSGDRKVFLLRCLHAAHPLCLGASCAVVAEGGATCPACPAP